MKIVTYFVSTFLTWVAFDLALYRRKISGRSAAAEVSRDYSPEELARKKQLQQRHLSVIPRRWPKGRRPVRSKCNYFSNKPKDVGYSDQRKIRRRINNQ